MKNASAYGYLAWMLGLIICVMVIARYVTLSSNFADLGFFLNNFSNIENFLSSYM
jgi:hypothetical protein